MAGNTIGSVFRLTTFGESHGVAIGGILDGCPAGLSLSVEEIQKELDRRRPGQSSITTQRKESDTLKLLSGVFNGLTTGTPIGFIIDNSDAKSKDYDHLKDVFRPSHADKTYSDKYGVRDHRGGGRSSARETACRIVGGAIARQVLNQTGLGVKAYVSAVGEVELLKNYNELDLTAIDTNVVRCPDKDAAGEMTKHIESMRIEGDSAGGVVTCVVTNVPTGLGDPVFDKLNADLAKAVMSINAVKGFELGKGFSASKMRGSEHNDSIEKSGTTTNNAGGIVGGISNGEDIIIRAAFKPVATISKPQNTVTKDGDSVVLEAKGRHDPCVVPRAVPIVEAMVLLTLADHYLRNKIARID